MPIPLGRKQRADGPASHRSTHHHVVNGAHEVVAYHNSTPAAVLKAPARRITWLVRHEYANREMRRNAWTRSGHRVHIPKHRQGPALNVPYRKPDLADALGDIATSSRRAANGLRALATAVQRTGTNLAASWPRR